MRWGFPGLLVPPFDTGHELLMLSKSAALFALKIPFNKLQSKAPHPATDQKLRPDESLRLETQQAQQRASGYNQNMPLVIGQSSRGPPLAVNKLSLGSPLGGSIPGSDVIQGNAATQDNAKSITQTIIVNKPDLQNTKSVAVTNDASCDTTTTMNMWSIVETELLEVVDAVSLYPPIHPLSPHPFSRAKLLLWCIISLLYHY